MTQSQNIVLVSGAICSGKSTCGHFLNKFFGFNYLEAGDVVHDYYTSTDNNYKNVHEFASDLLKNDPLIVSNYIADKIKVQENSSSTIVCGFRSAGEIRNLQRIFSNNQIKIVFLHAPLEKRYYRSLERGRYDVSLDIGEFKKINQLQDKLGLMQIAKLEDAYNYQNTGTVVELLVDMKNFALQ